MTQERDQQTIEAPAKEPSYDQQPAPRTAGSMLIKATRIEFEEKLLIVQNAECAGERIAAQALIDDVRSNFESFIKFGSATDIHVLNQALAAGLTSGSLVESFLWQIGINLPEEKEAA